MEMPRWQYHLRVLQQPSRARLCSFKEANDTIDRRPVDPPPAVEVYTLGDNSSLLESTSLFIHASLVLPDLDGFSFPPAKTPSGISATTGETIQTPEKLRMMDERLGSLCVFAKLSIRMPGLFRLKFTLYETTQMGLCQVGDTVSEPFEVFSPKLFTGMRESTMFTRHLAMQGIKVKLRSDTSAGRAERKPPRKRRLTPPPTSSPSLVWRPEYQPRPSRLKGDDGLAHLAHLALESEFTPTGSSADLSSFSLGLAAGPDRPTLQPSQRSDTSLITSTASLRLDSPRRDRNPPSRPAFRIGAGDDGLPSLPHIHPVLPHISNLLGPPASPPPRLPPLRLREDQL